MAEPSSAYVILVVEDNQDIAIGVQDLLRHDGYQVDIAGTCARAIELARARRYNAVLLDLTLPDGDGLEVLTTVHELDPTVPIVIVTASTSIEKTVGSLTRGAFAYMTKPYHREELRQTLRRAIGVKELTVKVAQAEGLLSESEERFRSLVESATDAIVVANGCGTILSWNRSASNLFGYTDEEAIGRPLTLLMPERYRIPHERGLARMETTGESHIIGSVVELHGLKKTGAEFPIELALASWKVGDKRFYSGIIRDSTERKKAEAALVASEERLELVIRGSSDGFWDGQVLPNEPWHSPRTPVWCSPRVREMLGYSKEEFPDVLESWTSRLHPGDRAHVYAALEAHIERREPYDVEYRLLTSQEHYEWFRARGQAIWDESGRLRRMAGSLQCTTDRKRAEETLRRSEQLLQDIVNHTTAVIYVKYADGRYLLANRRFEQLFNLTRDQIVGRTDHQLFPREIADVFRSNDLRVLERNAPEEYEELAPHADGLHTYLSIKFPLRDETGAPYALCGISSDITQHKQAENRLCGGKDLPAEDRLVAQLGLWNWDVQADRFYWSPQVSALLGIGNGPGSGNQEDVLVRVYPEDRTTTRLALRRAIQQPGKPVTFSHRVVWTDGTHHWLIWTGDLVCDRTGSPVNGLGTVREGVPPRG